MPDRQIGSIAQLDYDELERMGLRGLIIDLDNTLLPRRALSMSAEVQSWLQGLGARGVRAVIVSNNWTGRVGRVAEAVGLPLVAPAVKPSRRAFRKALAMMGTRPDETAVIGDQLFTDIFGGNRMNLQTILVDPVGDDELVHTRILRRLERLVLRGRNAN